MIFQLGARLWKINDIQIDSPPFKPNSESLHILLVKLKIENLTIFDFEKLLNLLPLNYILKLYFFENKPGYSIYGIVSSFYNPLNQNDFRENFIHVCTENSISLDVKNTKQFYHKKFNSYIELIDVILDQSINDTFKMSLIISYGKNNGHKSYTFLWLSSLNSGEKMFFNVSEYNWKNNPRVINELFSDFPYFINSLVAEGKALIEDITYKINVLKNIPVTNPIQFLNTLLVQIKISNATKDRIVAEFLNLEKNETSSCWLITKSLITYGDRANRDTSVNMQNLIKQAYLDIINKGYEDAYKDWSANDGLKAKYFDFSNLIKNQELI